jgi:DNA helicase-2/ATP-dependent DNA helicase PcrA
MQVANRVNELIKNGTSPKEIAVIYRDNRDSIDMIEALKTLHIQYRLDSGEDILQNRQIKKFIRLLFFLINPGDNALLFEVLSSSFFGLPLFDLIKINDYLKKTPMSLLELITSIDLLGQITLSDKKHILEVGSLLKLWLTKIQEEDPLSLLWKLSIAVF